MKPLNVAVTFAVMAQVGLVLVLYGAAANAQQRYADYVAQPDGDPAVLIAQVVNDVGVASIILVLVLIASAIGAFVFNLAIEGESSKGLSAHQEADDTPAAMNSPSLSINEAA